MTTTQASQVATSGVEPGDLARLCPYCDRPLTFRDLYMDFAEPHYACFSCWRAFLPDDPQILDAVRTGGGVDVARGAEKASHPPRDVTGALESTGAPRTSAAGDESPMSAPSGSPLYGAPPAQGAAREGDGPRAAAELSAPIDRVRERINARLYGGHLHDWHRNSCLECSICGKPNGLSAHLRQCSHCGPEAGWIDAAGGEY